jgi:hypothetical protein
MKNSIIGALQYVAESHWAYLVYWLPFTVFLIVFYLKNKKVIGTSFMSFILWAKESLETAHQASPEKLTAFMVMNAVYIPSRLMYAIKVTDPLHLLYGTVLDAIFVCVLYRIITPQQLVELKGGLISKEEKPEEKV